MSARKGESLPSAEPSRVGVSGGGARRIGGKSRETRRTPKPQTGKSRQPTRSRPDVSKPVDESLFQGKKKPQRMRDKTEYLKAVAERSSARQLAQETKRVNAEIRATGTFTEPTGNILKGLEAGAVDRERRTREKAGKPSTSTSSRRRVTLGPTEGGQRKISEPEPEPEPEPQFQGFVEPEPEPQFKIPDAGFDVDRVSRGNDAEGFGEPKQRRTPSTRPPSGDTLDDPFADIGGISQLSERLGTGGGSGGLIKQRSAPTKAIGNVGLSRTGSNPLGRTEATPSITGFAPASSFKQGGASPRGQGITLKPFGFGADTTGNLGAFDRISD